MTSHYQVQISSSAKKSLDKLPKPIRELVSKQIYLLSTNPRPMGCKKLIDSQDLYRIRVQDYRVVYAINDGRLIVLIVKIGHRRDVYRSD